MLMTFTCICMRDVFHDVAGFSLEYSRLDIVGVWFYAHQLDIMEFFWLLTLVRPGLHLILNMHINRTVFLYIC